MAKKKSSPKREPSSAMLRRTFVIMRILSSERLTTSELIRRLQETQEFGDRSKRTIQRDLRALMDAGIADCFDEFGPPEWFIREEYANIVPTKFTNHERVSIYVLKSYLTQFKNTAIAKDTESLLKKLDKTATGEEVISMSLEHAFGQYHYRYDDTLIERVVDYIVGRRSVTVTYHNSSGQTKSYDVQLCRMFHFNGELYVAAYIQKHKTYSTLALRNIRALEDTKVEYLMHVFQEAEFLRTRFGVYHGEPVAIKLHVRAEMGEFFRNRTWHPTQSMTMNEDGSGEMTMRVPIAPDLVSWIVGWSPYLSVSSPKSLRTQVVQRLVDGAEANDITAARELMKKKPRAKR